STTPAPCNISTLPLHDALPISRRRRSLRELGQNARRASPTRRAATSPETHTWVNGRLLPPPQATPVRRMSPPPPAQAWRPAATRSEEHTSELQSRFDLVCRLLL